MKWHSQITRGNREYYAHSQTHDYFAIKYRKGFMLDVCYRYYGIRYHLNIYPKLRQAKAAAEFVETNQID